MHNILIRTEQNVHQWGDQWNGEDLSIYSFDDQPLPISAVPRSKAGSLSSNHAPPRLSEDVAVTPDNIKRTLTNDAPSVSSLSTAANPANASSLMNTTDPELKIATPGYRAAEAYVRPAPVAVAGDITHYTFDLKSCTFTLNLRTAKEPGPDAPTEFFLPEYHFPRDGCVVEVSSGKWEIGVGEDGVQRLRWWHGKAEQSIKIVGQVRKYGAGAGKDGAAGEEPGYYDMVNNWLANGCVVM